ncbi:MAG: RNA chaperone Hfq [Pseudomonadota bacterium]|nr:RNA chaperone Hfq [Pseudomonadota bacterium]
MPARPLSLQDHFLNGIRKSKAPVTVFLMKGVKLQGVITWFDAFSLLLRRDGVSQLVYKHAISTIMPSSAPDMSSFGIDGGKGEGTRSGLQDQFLAAAARDQEAMTVFLVNGVMLQGAVEAYDQFSLLLARAGQAQLVYKHAISTLQPANPLNLDGGEEPAEPGQ